MRKLLAQIFLSPIAKEAFRQAAEVFIEVAANKIVDSITKQQEANNSKDVGLNKTNVLPFNKKEIQENTNV